MGPRWTLMIAQSDSCNTGQGSSISLTNILMISIHWCYLLCLFGLSQAVPFPSARLENLPLPVSLQMPRPAPTSYNSHPISYHPSSWFRAIVCQRECAAWWVVDEQCQKLQFKLRVGTTNKKVHMLGTWAKIFSRISIVLVAFNNLQQWDSYVMTIASQYTPNGNHMHN